MTATAIAIISGSGLALTTSSPRPAAITASTSFAATSFGTGQSAGRPAVAASRLSRATVPRAREPVDEAAGDRGLALAVSGAVQLDAAEQVVAALLGPVGRVRGPPAEDDAQRRAAATSASGDSAHGPPPSTTGRGPGPCGAVIVIRT